MVQGNWVSDQHGLGNAGCAGQYPRQRYDQRTISSDGWTNANPNTYLTQEVIMLVSDRPRRRESCGDQRQCGHRDLGTAGARLASMSGNVGIGTLTAGKALTVNGEVLLNNASL